MKQVRKTGIGPRNIEKNIQDEKRMSLYITKKTGIKDPGKPRIEKGDENEQNQSSERVSAEGIRKSSLLSRTIHYFAGSVTSKNDDNKS